MAGRSSTPLGRHGFRQRVVTVVLAGTVALIAALGWIGWRSATDVREQLVHERTALARTVALQVEQLFDDELASLSGVGLDLDFVSDPLHVETRLREGYRRTRLFERVFLVRLDGSPAYVAPVSTTALPDWIRDAAARAATTARPSIVPVEADGGATLFLVPLGEPNRPLAVVGGQLPRNHPYLSRMLTAAVPGGSSGIRLENSNSGIAAWGGVPVGSMTTPLLEADARVGQFGWKIRVAQPEADALAPLYGSSRLALVLSPVLVLVAVLLAWGSAASVVRPLGVLTRAAESLASGNLETPIPATGSDEAGRLGRALDDMRVALKRSIDEIEAANEALEVRVAERTRELKHLTEELRGRERLRGELLKKAITAQEDERKRVARELHDETSQMVNALLMELDAALASYPSEMTRAQLSVVRQLGARLLDGVHRLILDLRPSILDDLGLVSAIEWYARRHLETQGLAIRFEASDLELRLPREIELALFRVAQETLTNIARHARADTVLIQCLATPTQFSLDIEDDGEGFDLAGVTTDPTSLRGLGLAGMRERVSLVGGHITIESAPGEGTHVLIEVPLPQESALHA